MPKLVNYTPLNLFNLRHELGFPSVRKFCQHVQTVDEHSMAHMEDEAKAIDPTVRRILQIQEALKPHDVQFTFGEGELKEINSGGDLAELRKSLGFTQESAGEQIGISWQTLLDLETQKNANGGRLSTVLKLAKGYGFKLAFGSQYLQVLEAKKAKRKKKTKARK